MTSGREPPDREDPTMTTTPALHESELAELGYVIAAERADALGDQAFRSLGWED